MPVNGSGLAVTQITLPGTPKAPELGFVVSGDARFYVVWRVRGDGDLPHTKAIGIWCGEGSDVYFELAKRLPAGKYVQGKTELKRYDTWEDAWQAWWIKGKRSNPEDIPIIYHIVAGGGDAAR